MPNNYDNAAWFYDSLSRAVFGKAIINAQLYLLQYIPPKSTILIVGGGTGWILDDLTNLHPAGLKITYVEVSAKMMALSRKRNLGGNGVTFINAAVQETLLHNDFDVVITPFLFDNFSQQTAQKVFAHLNAALKPDGLWLYADFEPTGKWWQVALLKIMFLFFRMLCGVEASKLPQVKKLFTRKGYRVIYKQHFFGSFIHAEVFSK